jgi:hypothetical protein
MSIAQPAVPEFVKLIPAANGCATPYRRRRWFAFSLRTMFVGLTFFSAFSVWLGYHVQWIRDREKGREWLGRHCLPMCGCSLTWPSPKVPWSLAILGESAELFDRIIVFPQSADKKDLAAYRKHVKRLSELFPECTIVDGMEAMPRLNAERAEARRRDLLESANLPRKQHAFREFEELGD